MSQRAQKQTYKLEIARYDIISILSFSWFSDTKDTDQMLLLSEAISYCKQLDDGELVDWYKKELDLDFEIEVIDDYKIPASAINLGLFTCMLCGDLFGSIGFASRSHIEQMHQKFLMNSPEYTKGDLIKRLSIIGKNRVDELSKIYYGGSRKQVPLCPKANPG